MYLTTEQQLDLLEVAVPNLTWCNILPSGAFFKPDAKMSDVMAPELLYRGLGSPDREPNLAERIWESVMGRDVAIHVMDKRDLHLGWMMKRNFDLADNRVRVFFPDEFKEIKSGTWSGQVADIWFQIVVTGKVLYGVHANKMHLL